MSGGRRTAPPRVAAARAPARPRERVYTWTIADLAGFRAAAYRLFAALWLSPEAPRLAWLAATARRLRADAPAVATLGFFGPWQQLLGLLAELSQQSLPALQAEHVRLFSLDPAGTPCFPYESSYVEAGRTPAGWVALQLERTYARAGLRLAATLHDPPDHAAVELEFMAYLCAQETAAWEEAALDAGLQLLREQRGFLRVHLARWFPLFASQVRVRATQPLYAVGADAASAFVHHDRDLLDTLVNEIGRLRSGAEADDGTDAPPVQEDIS